MLKHFIGASLLVLVVSAGHAQAGPIDWQQPYFTYSPGAQDFEQFEWTPLEFAAFSAYGGYFANVRQPRFETPLPDLFVEPELFGFEDEVKFAANVQPGPTFLPQPSAFPTSAPMTFVGEEPGDEVPEPGMLALIGGGLLVGSRVLRRRRNRA